ncbi:MAG: sulfotransferase [Thiobacillaceae bacterium]
MSTPSRIAGHDARRLSQRFNRAFWRQLKQLRQKVFPHPVQQHVFVAGMQRSGTNLLMDVLDASQNTQVFHETDPRAFLHYEMRDRNHIQQLAAECPAPVFVIKALCELDQITSLMRVFSQARTLWVIRDWRDSVNSAIQSFGNFVQQWHRLAYSPEINDWRGHGMSDATRAVLRTLYRSDASEADGAAIMWYYRNILFFEQQLEYDPRVRLIFYEDLVQDPVPQVAAVYKFLGLAGFNTRIAHQIHARSISRRSAPDVTPAVAELCNVLHIRFMTYRKGGTA